MKILFVYSLAETQSVLKPLISPEQINFGISYIAGLLKKNGHDPNIVVLSSGRQRKSFELMDQNIKEFKPEIIGFHIIATQHTFLSEVAKRTKEKYPNICMTCWGTHPLVRWDRLHPGR